MKDPYAVDPEVRNEVDEQARLAYASDCERCYREADGKLSLRQFPCARCGAKTCPGALDHRNECTGEQSPQLVGGLENASEARAET